ncbi:hypothetical protein GF354_04790 [Candidatus Peregrinibacteria bacterium]|nr:hypothetical protein [Candidatus Peregrinibacteria bacterium]
MKSSFTIKVSKPLSEGEAKPEAMVGDAEGNWKPTDKIIWARMHVENDIKELEEIFNPYKEYFSTGRIKNIRYKLYALRYEKEAYIKAEEEKEREYKKGFQPGLGMEFTESNLRALYRVESFLFQAKSTLDIMSLILKDKIQNYTFEGFGKSCDENNEELAGQKIIKELKKIDSEHDFEPLIKLIKDNQSWLTELVKERDKIAHNTSIQALWFVELTYKGGDYLEIVYPHMPNDIRIKEYLELVERRLHIFVQNFLSLVSKF